MAPRGAPFYCPSKSKSTTIFPSDRCEAVATARGTVRRPLHRGIRSSSIQMDAGVTRDDSARCRVGSLWTSCTLVDRREPRALPACSVSSDEAGRVSSPAGAGGGPLLRAARHGSQSGLRPILATGSDGPPPELLILSGENGIDKSHITYVRSIRIGRLDSPMARSISGRVVLEVSPELKRRLHSRLAAEGRTLKEWFLEQASAYLSRSGPIQLPLGLSPAESPRPASGPPGGARADAERSARDPPARG